MCIEIYTCEGIHISEKSWVVRLRVACGSA
jgi:hypothetical protein